MSGISSWGETEDASIIRSVKHVSFRASRVFNQLCTTVQTIFPRDPKSVLISVEICRNNSPQLSLSGEDDSYPSHLESPTVRTEMPCFRPFLAKSGSTPSADRGSTPALFFTAIARGLFQPRRRNTPIVAADLPRSPGAFGIVAPPALDVKSGVMIPTLISAAEYTKRHFLLCRSQTLSC